MQIGLNGYICKPDIFEATYEPVNTSPILGTAGEADERLFDRKDHPLPEQREFWIAVMRDDDMRAIVYYPATFAANPSMCKLKADRLSRKWRKLVRIQKVRLVEVEK